jgi:hypothetical protein
VKAPPNAPDAPHALTLDEVLEQMLPICDNSAFEVAEWLDNRIKRALIRLLADGIFVPPHLYSTHLAVKAQVAADARPSLKVMVLRAFGHTEKAEAVVGRDKEGKPIKQSYDKLREPIKQWAVERESFEANHPGAPRNRGGRPLKYHRDRILTEALIYIAVNGVPDSLDGEGGLFEKLELELKPSEIPERTALYDIFTSIWKRIEDERNKANKQKKNPVR